MKKLKKIIKPLNYVTNCYIHPRIGETLFTFSEDDTIVTLNHYAIIPMEVYNTLQPKSRWTKFLELF